MTQLLPVDLRGKEVPGQLGGLWLKKGLVERVVDGYIY